jgi:D-alanyl-D-alanine carboxypeptidase (penicillin-binding protein 5/6)
MFIILITFTAPLFPQAQSSQFTGIYYSPLIAYIETVPDILSLSAVLIDAATGTLLYTKNAHEEIPPASLTKLMTMHLVQNEIYAGRASPDDIISITSESWAINQPPRSSLMFLGPGQTVTLRDILLGMAVSSGNDAAVAAALALTPTVADFVSIMNSEARRLGLAKTRFVEPSGISEFNMTCAADFAYFCRFYLAAHPSALTDSHSVREFSYPRAENVAAAFRSNPRTITQYNRNALLRNFSGIDGLKTGYIDEAGYNIALTAERNGSRFITVILGAPAQPGGDRIRDDDGRRLLTWAFDNFKTVYPEIGVIEGARLWKGKENTAQFKLAQRDSLNTDSGVFTAPADRAHSLWISYEITDPLCAPLPADYPAGVLIISDEQGELHRVQLLTVKAYERGNIFKRMWHSLRLLFYRGR